METLLSHWVSGASFVYGKVGQFVLIVQWDDFPLQHVVL